MGGCANHHAIVSLSLHAMGAWLCAAHRLSLFRFGRGLCGLCGLCSLCGLRGLALRGVCDLQLQNALTQHGL